MLLHAFNQEGNTIKRTILQFKAKNFQKSTQTENKIVCKSDQNEYAATVASMTADGESNDKRNGPNPPRLIFCFMARAATPREDTERRWQLYYPWFSQPPEGDR